MSDEIVDIVDELDTVIGQAPRGEAYARRLCHRTAFVLARSPDDRIFVHRRTATKAVFPSCYDMFVGGVVGAGETYDEAALREATEELGVPVPPPEFRFKFLYSSAEHLWWAAVYTVRCPVDVRPQESEVDWFTFLTDAELEAVRPQWTWVPDGLEAWHHLHPHCG
jgi:8-oxo-dGTP pyrophosphatase MutT (NUDIX family)